VTFRFSGRAYADSAPVEPAFRATPGRRCLLSGLLLLSP
jgi:hypothetical protein